MPIDPETVDHVALLARLELTPEARARFQGQLGAILDYITIINRLDLAGVPPTSHVVPIANVFRDDVPGPPLPRDVVLGEAPEAADGAFKVPRVIEEP